MQKVLDQLWNFRSVKNLALNQFVIYFENWEIFQSYQSIISIVLYNENWYYLTSDYDTSKTTWKYRNIFLWNDKKEVEKDLKNWDAIIL